MFIYSPKKILSLWNYFITLYLFCVAFSYYACSYFVKDDHPEYFNAVFKNYDSLISDESMLRLDSAFNAFPGTGSGDKAGLYLRKCDYYSRYKKDPHAAMPYADSLIALLEKKQNDERFNVTYGKAFFIKGDIYFGLMNYDKALENFIAGKEILIKNKSNQCELFAYTARIASLTDSQSKFCRLHLIIYRCAKSWRIAGRKISESSLKCRETLTIWAFAIQKQDCMTAHNIIMTVPWIS
jgi:hypothetical protein